MNRSGSDYSSPPDAELSYNKMCWRNGHDVGWYGNSGRDELNDMVMVERNGMAKCSDVDRSVRDVDGIVSDVRCSGSDGDRKESIVNRSVRADDGESNVHGSSRDVNGTVNVTSDVAHSIFQLATLARKKFAQHFQPGRKLDFSPEDSS